MKNDKKRIGIVLVAILLIAVLLVGYTFSKYKQSIEVSTSSTVAKWSFAGKVINSKNSSVLSTISLADTIQTDSVAGKRIAPGTSGEFSVVIDGSGSEVDLDYTVELIEETNKPQNLIFTYNNENYNNLSALISEIKEDGEKEFSGRILHDAENKEITYNIEWEWPYETTKDGILQDEIDLQDGQNITDYTFTLKITGSQSI